jgi:hypothetical protein
VPLVLPKGALAQGFQPHGISVSNASDLLYAVNHAANYTGVEVFRIQYPGSGGGELGRGLCLHHLKTVWTESLHRGAGIHALNDVVEGTGRGELFVTQWLPYGNPKGGRSRPETLAERARVAALLPITLSGVKLTTVWRCMWSAGGLPSGISTRCAVATREVFQLQTYIYTYIYTYI